MKSGADFDIEPDADFDTNLHTGSIAAHIVLCQNFYIILYQNQHVLVLHKTNT